MKIREFTCGSVPGVCVGVVPYLRWTGNSSLVEMTSREFQPMMETPAKMEERRTTTSSVLSWSGMTQISRELSPDTTRENTARARGGYTFMEPLKIILGWNPSLRTFR